MYERFTDQARMVMRNANAEALSRGYERIDVQDVLLGLLQIEDGPAAEALKLLNADRQKIRLALQKTFTTNSQTMQHGKLPQTLDAKKVIDYAMDQARKLCHNYVETEHILLALLLDEKECSASVNFLRSHGITYDKTRDAVLYVLGMKTPPVVYLGNAVHRFSPIRELGHAERIERILSDVRELLEKETFDVTEILVTGNKMV